MENAQPSPKKEPSALDSAKSKPRCLLTPRQRRVLAALVTSGRWIPREEIDRIAGASNGPQVIAELRHGWGVCIDMQRVAKVDRDGKACKPGEYRISALGLARLAELGNLDG